MRKGLMWGIVVVNMFAACHESDEKNAAYTVPSQKITGSIYATATDIGKNMAPGSVKFCSELATILAQYDALNFYDAEYSDKALYNQARILGHLLKVCRDKTPDAFAWYTELVQSGIKGHRRPPKENTSCSIVCHENEICSYGKCINLCSLATCGDDTQCEMGLCVPKVEIHYDCEVFPKAKQAAITAWEHYRMGSVCKVLVADYNAAIDIIPEDDPDVPPGDVGAVARQCTEKWLSGKGITSAHARAYGEKMVNCLGLGNGEEDKQCAAYHEAKEKCLVLWDGILKDASCEAVSRDYAAMVAAIPEDDPEISADDAPNIVRKCTNSWLNSRTISDAQATAYSEKLMTCVVQP